MLFFVIIKPNGKDFIFGKTQPRNFQLVSIDCVWDKNRALQIPFPVECLFEVAAAFN